MQDRGSEIGFRAYVHHGRVATCDLTEVDAQLRSIVLLRDSCHGFRPAPNPRFVTCLFVVSNVEAAFLLFMQRRLCKLHAHLLIASACEHNVFGGRATCLAHVGFFCSAAGVLYLTISGLAPLSRISTYCSV